MINNGSLLDYLVKQALLINEKAEEARMFSSEWGTTLARTLLAMGAINALSLYQAIASLNKLTFANLHITPCSYHLLQYRLRDDYQRMNVIPWKAEGDGVILACSEITPQLKSWAAEQFGESGFAFAITSPYDIQDALFHHFSQQDDALAREHLWKHEPLSSAKELFFSWNIRHWWLPAMLLSASFFITPAYSFIALFITANLFYILTLGIKWGLFLHGATAYRRHAKKQGITELKNSELPVYTLLVPLYKETQVLAKLTHALQSLDYPKAKLDIKLIVEADDTCTIEAIKALRCKRIFEIIRVPYSLPRTKPKACNYALNFARGDYVTIYDAEDIPEPLQLKKALWTFEQADEDTVCVQARLNYFNRNENWLTKLFALEYAGLFDFLLWGVEKLNIPIPLGGTSNHFKMNALRSLYAWDPYNVTEDADLGIRIAKRGWKVTVMDSLTLEEAPITLNEWIRQRSRWIKGHMQTYFVHMRKPLKLWKQLGTIGFFGFQFFLGAPCLIFIISPIMWLLWIASLIGISPSILSILPPEFSWIIPLSVSIFIAGLIMQIGFALWIIATHRWFDLWLSTLLYPFYWLLHSLASFRAVWQLFKRPHYWEKTTHGVTKIVLKN